MNHELHLNQKEQPIPECIMQDAQNYFLGYIHRQFEVPSDPRAKLPYHNCPHTLRVADDTEMTLTAIHKLFPKLVTVRDIQRGRLASLAHDPIQHWKTVITVENGYRKEEKKRYIGFNERASAHMLLMYMRMVNANHGPTFTDKEMLQAPRPILATTPLYDQKLKTFIQPLLKPGIDLISLSLARADLCGPGIHGGDTLVNEGDWLFQELYHDVGMYLQAYEYLSDQHKEALRQRMLVWTRGQIDFARGRLSREEEEMKLFGEARVAVEGLYSRLPEALEIMEKKVADREGMDLLTLARDMRFNV